MIVVVDAGLGNVASVANMLNRIGVKARVATEPDSARMDEGYVLPGVGAFDTGIRRLADRGWLEFLQGVPQEHPLLGICLGMQLLSRGSQEGALPGLNRVGAEFRHFDRSAVRVPHMGWNVVRPVGDSTLFEAGEGKQRFYFTHSYFAVCDDERDVVARCRYGDDFVAAYRSGGTWGVQFHPEKSHRFGMALLRRWVAWACSETE